MVGGQILCGKRETATLVMITKAKLMNPPITEPYQTGDNHSMLTYSQIENPIWRGKPAGVLEVWIMNNSAQ